MNLRISRFILFLLVMSAFAWSGKAQADLIETRDSLAMVTAQDSSVQAVLRTADSISVPKIKEPFKSNPTRAVIYSAVFPGLGQIYNKKYWKLPLVYGGFMGFIYAVTWNNKNYKDYSVAYLDIMTDDPKADPSTWHQSWQNLIPAVNPDPKDWIDNSNFKDNLKRRKDFYRRNRDLSIILTAGWYFICMIDSYIDAELFDFDISPDLSMRVEPVVAPRTSYSPGLYGVNCSVKF